MGVKGLNELLEGKWKDLNRTGAPKISATMPLEFSGIVELKVPTATIEEVYWVNVTKPKPKPNVTNATENATADGAEKKEDKTEEDKKEEDKKEEDKKEEDKNEEDKKEEDKAEEDKTEEDKTEDKKEETKEEEKKEDATGDNATNASENA